MPPIIEMEFLHFSQKVLNSKKSTIDILINIQSVNMMLV